MFDEEKDTKKLWLAVLLGLGAFTVISCILLPILAIAVSSLPDPSGAVYPVSLCVLYVSAFAGGLAAKIKGGTLTAPLICAAALTVIILAISAVLTGAGSFSAVEKVIAHIALFLTFPLGALTHTLITAKRPQRRRKRKRR